jgi:hypothetical protein
LGFELLVVQLLIDSALEFGMAPVWEGGPVVGVGGFIHVDPHIDGAAVWHCLIGVWVTVSGR